MEGKREREAAAVIGGPDADVAVAAVRIHGEDVVTEALAVGLRLPANALLQLLLPRFPQAGALEGEHEALARHCQAAVARLADAEIDLVDPFGVPGRAGRGLEAADVGGRHPRCAGAIRLHREPRRRRQLPYPEGTDDFGIALVEAPP